VSAVCSGAGTGATDLSACGGESERDHAWGVKVHIFHRPPSSSTTSPANESCHFSVGFPACRWNLFYPMEGYSFPIVFRPF
jgi:hypothetical protein